MLCSNGSPASPLRGEGQGEGWLSDESRATIAKIVEDVKKYIKMSTELSAGEVLYSFLMESGLIKNLMSNPTPENEEKIENMSRFFNVIRSSEDVLKQSRVWEFVKHLNSLIDAGDNPATAEADLDADAVNVLTVHKAKGLEFTVVFMVGLVDMKFPLSNRKEPIPLPVPLIKEILPSGDFHVQEERRLFYVGMTRAKQELCLTNARDYGGSRTRKVSRFVLEALDIPKVDTKAVKLSSTEKLGAWDTGLKNSSIVNRQSSIVNGMLVLSHYQIDDYLTCPLKYKYVHVLRVPILQHHSIIYGKAIHEAVKEYNRRKAAGKNMSLKELISVFKGAWSSEGFLTREHEEQRLESGKNALKLFYEREERSGDIPAFVEKEFSFPINNPPFTTSHSHPLEGGDTGEAKGGQWGIRVKGRWDRIDIKKDETVIIDFKSSDIREQKDADRRAKESLQLSIYALAYREVYGNPPSPPFTTFPSPPLQGGDTGEAKGGKGGIKVELHFLESGLIGRYDMKEDVLEETIVKIKEVAEGIRQKNYEARPQYIACRYCAYSEICPHL
jgi:DNA helicase-2/ATP-dependent DNA helicase PcrA